MQGLSNLKLERKAPKTEVHALFIQRGAISEQTIFYTAKLLYFCTQIIVHMYM